MALDMNPRSTDLEGIDVLSPQEAAPAADQQPSPLAAYFRSSLVLLVLGLGVYAPAIFLEYGRADDYWMLLQSVSARPSNMAEVWLDLGRPGSALLGTWGFSLVHTVAELSYLRLIALVALAAIGAVLSSWTHHVFGQTDSRSKLILACIPGVLVMSTPAAPSATTWAVMAAQLWALPLGVLAGIFATRRRVFGLRWEIPSGIALLVSVYTYQPAAAACLLPVFTWSALRWAQHEKPDWIRPLLMLAMLVIGLASNLLIVTVFHLPGAARLEAGGGGIAQSLAWFLVEFLPRTVDAGVPWSSGTAAVTALVLIAALLSPVIVGRRHLALSVAVVAAWMCSAGIVIPGELWATYRLVMTPQTVLWGGSALCLVFTVWRCRLVNPKSAKIVTAVLVAISIVSLGVAGTRAYSFLAVPNAVDWSSVRCVVDDAAPLSKADRLVLNDRDASVSSVVSYDEYGVIASGIPWAIAPITWLAAREVDQDGLPPTVAADQLKVLDPRTTPTPSQHDLQFPQTVCGARPAH